jgi:hypothetical protein
MRLCVIATCMCALLSCVTAPEPWTPSGGGDTGSSLDQVADTYTGDVQGSQPQDAKAEDLEPGDVKPGDVAGELVEGLCDPTCTEHQTCVDGACLDNNSCDPFSDYVCFPDGEPEENTGWVCTMKGEYSGLASESCESFKDCPSPYNTIQTGYCFAAGVDVVPGWDGLNYWPTALGKCFARCSKDSDCELLGETLVCDKLYDKVTVKICKEAGAFAALNEAGIPACP